jgi:hypothetical protein
VAFGVAGAAGFGAAGAGAGRPWCSPHPASSEPVKTTAIHGFRGMSVLRFDSEITE